MSVQEFKNYPCWDRKWISTIFNTDADSVPDHVFMATHTEPELMVQFPPYQNRNFTKTKPDALLEEQFLKPGVDRMMFAVIGEPGTGKTHLIKRMDLAIPVDQQKWAKIRLPRAGTTLRGMLYKIIDLLPDNQQEQYKTRLSSSGIHELSEELKRHRIISNIATAIRQDKASKDDSIEKLIIEELPNVFDDPNLREKLESDSLIISELASHVFDTSQVDRRTAPRAFQNSDLLLDAVVTSDLARSTQVLWAQLKDDDQLLESAIKIINRNLELAIELTLSFSAENLIDLVREIRTHLKQESKEFIVLIEELVSNQGYQESLLDALLEPATEENGYCVIRWGFATTTQHFPSLLPSLRQRLNFVVDMNVVEDESNQTFAGMDPGQFVARYLNAARVGEKLVRDWYADTSAVVGSEPVESHCTDCQFISSCHATFDDVDEIGLYPFTQEAIRNIDQRVRGDEQGFNPRAFLNTISYVLDQRYPDLVGNKFPTIEMFDQIRNQSSPLNAGLTQNLRAAEDEATAARQQVLIELWSPTPGVPEKIDDGIFQAFGLPVPVAGVYGTTPLPTDISDPETPRPPLTESEPQILTAINAWGGGDPMEDRYRTVIAPMIHQAIVNHIDWDTEGLVPTQISRPTGSRSLFRNTSIEFERQVASYTHNSPIHLLVPATPEEQTETTLALSGLVAYNRSGTWNFADAVNRMIALSNRLDAWAAQVLSQIREILDGDSTWKPTVAARELLAVGAFLNADPDIISDRTRPRLQGLLTDWETTQTVSDEWEKIRNRITDKRDELKQVALLDASGTKGGAGTAPLLDARKILQSVNRIVNKWQFSQSVPSDSRGLPFREISTLYKEVSESFENLTTKEVESRKKWLEDIQLQIELSDSKAQIVRALESLDKIRNENKLRVPASVINSFRDALKEFKNTQFDAAVKYTNELVGIQDRKAQFTSLAQDRTRNARAATIELLAAAERYMGEINSLLALEQSKLGIDDPGGDIDPEEVIKDALDDLETYFDGLEGKTDAD